MNASEYNIIVRQGSFDGEICFEARILELPDVTEYADSYEEAYELAVDTIVTTAEIFAEQGKEMPVPYSPETEFSGRVTLRMARSLHRRVAEIAEDEGVSINQFITTILSHQVGGMTSNKRRGSTDSEWSEGLSSKSKESRHLKLVSSQPLSKEAKYS